MKFISSYLQNKPNFICFVKSILTAHALTAVFHAPLQPQAYESMQDYYIASIYDFLGNYDFRFILLLALCMLFYSWLAHKLSPHTVFAGKASAAMSLFFSFCLLAGNSYYETQSWGYCFGSPLNFIRFTLSLAGYSFLLHGLILLLCDYFQSREFTSSQEHFFTRHAFGKSFFMILGSWAPFLLLSYPGNLCYDSIGQIEQVIVSGNYSSHHPLFHTLLMGGLTQLGQALFHSYEIGLFLYILLQAAFLAAALAATISVLAKRRARLSLLLSLLLIYCLAPVYSNMASTALKDVPYCGAIVGYVICLCLLLEKPDRINNLKFVLLFMLLQLGVILFRNNGLYVVLLSGVGIFCFLLRKYDIRQRILSLVCNFAGSILAAELLLAILSQTLGAAPGSPGEMLSLPFQQTARYLQLYRAEISPEERSAIEAVLGDVDHVAAVYDPDIADPVKASYHKDASLGEVCAYLGAWFRGLCRHPASYAEAFLVHVYGWFDPAVVNSIRYETDYKLISQEGLFPNAAKILIFYYRFAARIPLLSIFENVGAAVWALFFLCFYQRKSGKGAAVLSGLPLWISLLICMASPCFFNHPRYAFPILFSMPFLYGFTLTEQSLEQAAHRQKG